MRFGTVRRFFIGITLLLSQAGHAQQCFQTNMDNVLVFEGESLTPVLDWEILSTEVGASQDAYLTWTGSSQNNNIVDEAILTVQLSITVPGRYLMDIRSRIGQGNNTTEANDLWARIPDAADMYGRRPDGALETRRYPRPLCQDSDFIASVEALPEVSQAACAAGSSVENFLKVFSAGAFDWRWSALTSDAEGYSILVEFATPGVYTLELAPRSPFMLIDRIVLAEESLSRSVYRDVSLAETPCTSPPTPIPLPLWAVLLAAMGLSAGAIRTLGSAAD